MKQVRVSGITENGRIGCEERETSGTDSSGMHMDLSNKKSIHQEKPTCLAKLLHAKIRLKRL